PVTSFAIISFTFATALVTPRPRKRSFSPSRSSHASCSPLLAPLGTMALPVAPPASVTTASTVGLPRESMTWRPWTRTIFVIIISVLLLKYQHNTLSTGVNRKRARFLIHRRRDGWYIALKSYR